VRPRSLLESELFGHVRGAFTGAERDRDGAFSRAHGGSIFLDEIGDLDLDLQPRLLRAIERRHVKPVGASDYRTVDVRVIAATNRDLGAEVRAGRFRADLLHRLEVVKIELPPLRRRRDDVPLPVERFLARAPGPAGGPAPPRFSPATMAALAAHDWPGNVRQLRNVIERALALAPDPAAVDPELLGLTPAAPAGAPEPGPGPAEAALPFKEAKGRLVEAWEREYLARLLADVAGNVSEAARRAGLSRMHLHDLLRKHGLATAPPREE
jgi:DNA-binding NtrC family response regulator